MATDQSSHVGAQRAGIMIPFLRLHFTYHVLGTNDLFLTHDNHFSIYNKGLDYGGFVFSRMEAFLGSDECNIDERGFQGRDGLFLTSSPSRREFISGISTSAPPHDKLGLHQPIHMVYRTPRTSPFQDYNKPFVIL